MYILFILYHKWVWSLFLHALLSVALCLVLVALWLWSCLYMSLSITWVKPTTWASLTCSANHLVGVFARWLKCFRKQVYHLCLCDVRQHLFECDESVLNYWWIHLDAEAHWYQGTHDHMSNDIPHFIPPACHETLLQANSPNIIQAKTPPSIRQASEIDTPTLQNAACTALPSVLTGCK